MVYGVFLFRTTCTQTYGCFPNGARIYLGDIAVPVSQQCFHKLRSGKLMRIVNICHISTLGDNQRAKLLECCAGMDCILSQHTAGFKVIRLFSHHKHVRANMQAMGKEIRRSLTMQSTDRLDDFQCIAYCAAQRLVHIRE